MRIHLTPPPWATHLISDPDDWLRAPRPVAAMTPIDLADDAYFEYAYLDAQNNPRPDPQNPNPPQNPWWDHARYLAGPNYEPDPWAAFPARTAPAGKTHRLKIDSKHLGHQRHVLVYTPPGHENAELPHVWFQDGKAYYGWGKAPQVLDKLLTAGQCAPAHLVFIPPIDRSREYHFNDHYLAFLTEEVLPAVEQIAPSNNQRTAWGASMGGLCSAELAWRHPLKFQAVITQSGAFLFHPDQRIGDDPHSGQEWWAQRVHDEVWRPMRWYLETGTIENDEVQAKVGDIRFNSITFSLGKP